MELIGKRFGHIRVTEVVGQGGMGDVYGGYDEKLQRKVALKVLNSDQRLDREARERLLREARALSKLDHHNICRIHDYIESGDVDLLVLEYIDGRTLGDVMNERLTRGEKLRIAAAVAGVLVAAHRAGIVHRDLKPENVMLTKTGEVKVLDFGLARWLQRARRSSDRIAASRQVVSFGHKHAGDTMVLGSDSDDDASGPLATAVGITMGTPLYMSPEQARGELLTPASDMFSFGLLLQAFFTGQDPHPMGMTAREVILRVARGETNEVVNVPGDIAALIGRLKQYAPTDRPTAVETLTRLQFLLGKPQRFARRAIAAAIILLISIGAWRYTVDLKRERAIAVAAEAEAKEQRAHAEDLIEFMLGDLRKKLGGVGRLDIMDDVGKRAIEYVDSLNPEEMSGADVIRSSKALNQLGEVRIGQGRLPEAISVFEKSLGLATVAARKSPTDNEVLFTLGQSEFWVGNAYRLKGDSARALQHMRAYLAIGEKLAAIDPKSENYRMERAYGHSSVGTILEQQGELKPALEHYRVNLEIKRSLHLANPADAKRRDELAFTLNKVGFVLQQLGQLDAARGFFESELEMRQQLAATDPRQMQWKNALATSHNFLAYLLLAIGSDAEALEHCRAELELDRYLREHDPQNVGWRRNYAMTLMSIGRLSLREGKAAEAADALASAREIMQELVRDEPQRPSRRRDLASVQLYEAAALRALGRTGSALASLDSAIAGLEKQSSSEIALADALLARADLVGGVAAASDRRRAYALLLSVGPNASDPRILDVWARTLAAIGRVNEACDVHARLNRLGYKDRELQRFFEKQSCV